MVFFLYLRDFINEIYIIKEKESMTKTNKLFFVEKHRNIARNMCLDSPQKKKKKHR